MQELDDNALLREYVERGSEEAFATLVARHVNKVYSVALRHTGNPHQAEEITQAVFVILARKSARLGKRVILEGWLYQTARLTAVTLIRGEIRRVRREQEAQMQTALNENESEVWRQIAPLLDTAMASLNETDRHAVVLRFFYGKSMKEVGAALGGSEGAAKLRLHRAVEKLRQFFARRGVISTTAVIAGVISANTAGAAPVALARTAAALALAKGAPVGGSTLTLVKGALKVMAWTKAKTLIVVGVGILLAAGTTTVAVKEIQNYRGEVWQRVFDTTVVDQTPPQATILPAHRFRSGAIDAYGDSNDKWLGLGVSTAEIVQVAYDTTAGRLIFSVPVPVGKYDFIANLTNGAEEALKQAVKKKFGLFGRRELMETNVLVLTVRNREGIRNRDLTGLVPSSDADAASGHFNRSGTSILAVHRPISRLVYGLEGALGVPVVDQTGLTGDFDMTLRWDSTPESLKRALPSQMGLELTPGRAQIEYVIVEKANQP